MFMKRMLKTVMYDYIGSGFLCTLFVSGNCDTYREELISGGKVAQTET